MKHQFSRGTVITVFFLIGIALLFLVLYMFSNSTVLFNDTITKREYSDPSVSFGWIHMGFNFLLILCVIAWVVLFIWDMMDTKNSDDPSPLRYFYNNRWKEDNKLKEEPIPVTTIKWKRWIWIGILVILCFQILKIGKSVYTQSVFIYNSNKKYQNTYQQKVEEKQGFYDKLWKTYLQKEKITNINKDVFLQVTKMIMENRADGKTLTWKWLQENQQIPYEQFTVFYADLSNFITKEREGYFSIEKACQTIANKNNTMLDTFPNNLYNRVLKLDRIKFEYGFLSDSTNNIFKSKKENLKP